MLDACAGKIGILKPQIAFFEQYGPAGLSVLAEVLREAKQAGFLVIADAKRGDIGSSMDGYAKAWLSNEAAFECDALTLSPYLGVESLRSTVEVALLNQKGVFLLSATSNPEAHEVQSAISKGNSIAGQVASFAGAFNEPPIGSVGCVVGATVSLQKLGLSSQALANTPILMPGFGVQGVELSAAGKVFGELVPNLICSVSRSVAGTSRSGLVKRIESAKSELADGMSL
jgi:orotidine-5'-phosphate decarboxylase